MTTKNDGGPAFPSVLYSHERAENWSTDGMTLRDWFAGRVITGHWHADTEMRAGYARAAYAMADAMIAERSK